ncbi:uncharacterized protein SPAPADRAFT_49870 [Spathaspora passalidarum NRRL Y-27907]|uniref:Uncharacterized protein n=1 Tax=Spathaspora passalidarum (strain NRRL Y-27907 / 11-Y1) TaxID=619300 RepID=G3AKN7_SPAPN|nr:uncharacterized protein SPAPADRAFT_49870 [Spathaspora passalidarum NRRL Y-27907]EGW32941.1 hypothetical protein SPAPADRAFT_49870 [Spathaspora passalidarum NRRL Y-27907]
MTSISLIFKTIWGLFTPAEEPVPIVESGSDADIQATEIPSLRSKLRSFFSKSKRNSPNENPSDVSSTPSNFTPDPQETSTLKSVPSDHKHKHHFSKLSNWFRKRSRENSSDIATSNEQDSSYIPSLPQSSTDQNVTSSQFIQSQFGLVSEMSGNLKKTKALLAWKNLKTTERKILDKYCLECCQTPRRETTIKKLQEQLQVLEVRLFEAENQYGERIPDDIRNSMNEFAVSTRDICGKLVNNTDTFVASLNKESPTLSSKINSASAKSRQESISSTIFQMLNQEIPKFKADSENHNATPEIIETSSIYNSLTNLLTGKHCLHSQVASSHIHNVAPKCIQSSSVYGSLLTMRMSSCSQEANVSGIIHQDIITYNGGLVPGSIVHESAETNPEISFSNQSESTILLRAPWQYENFNWPHLKDVSASKFLDKRNKEVIVKIQRELEEDKRRILRKQERKEVKRMEHENSLREREDYNSLDLYINQSDSEDSEKERIRSRPVTRSDTYSDLVHKSKQRREKFRKDIIQKCAGSALICPNTTRPLY